MQQLQGGIKAATNDSIIFHIPEPHYNVQVIRKWLRKALEELHNFKNNDENSSIMVYVTTQFKLYIALYYCKAFRDIILPV